MPSAPAGLGAASCARLLCDALPWRRGSLPAAQLGADRCGRWRASFIRQAGGRGAESRDVFPVKWILTFVYSYSSRSELS